MMPHQVTIPDEMWEWAEDQARTRGEGPAAYLRALIIGAIAHNNNNKPSPPKQRERERYTTTTAATTSTKQAIIDVLEGRKIYSHGCKAILTGDDWDYIDPAGMMQKPPEDVEDFLQCCSYEVGMYADMFASRRNLLKMIFDAYMRAHRNRS